MVRPLRIEYPHACYHVMSRGNARENIYFDPTDKALFLSLLGEAIERFDLICYSYCLMDNHYHLLLETPKGNLSKAMRSINGRYTQKINRKYHRVGHLFQGRYKAILVQKDSYLLELSRYIVLNPVRARLCERPEQWCWSSYRATMGMEERPQWLAADNILVEFGRQRSRAREKYQAFVRAGIGVDLSVDITRQAYLGDEKFVEEAQKYITDAQKESIEIARKSKQSPIVPIEQLIRGASDRTAAMKAIYDSGHYTYFDIADYFGVHYSTVSRAINS